MSVPAGLVLAGPPRRGRILLVDDEDLVLRSIKRVLRDHDVVCMLSAREALALIDGGERFDLVLSDVVMQGMSGIEFYEALRRRHPDMARDLVFLSGGAISARSRLSWCRCPTCGSTSRSRSPICSPPCSACSPGGPTEPQPGPRPAFTRSGVQGPTRSPRWALLHARARRFGGGSGGLGDPGAGTRVAAL